MLPKIKCPSCNTDILEAYVSNSLSGTSLWCPFEKKWLDVEMYPTIDAQGSVIPYTTDEIIVLCVRNDEMEEFLTVGSAYRGRFGDPLPFKDGHWIEVITPEHTLSCLPERFVVVYP